MRVCPYKLDIFESSLKWTQRLGKLLVPWHQALAGYVTEPTTSYGGSSGEDLRRSARLCSGKF